MGSFVKRKLAGTCLRMAGWELFGERPKVPKAVLITAPHTSNWDFVWMILAAWHFDFKLSWLGKDTLFSGPLGGLLKSLGGIAVNRSSANNLVEQIAKEYHRRDSLFLGIPPEGTRRYRDYWKSGFYFIAVEAGVPVVPTLLDYGQRRIGLGPMMVLTGDVKSDMDAFRVFYEGAQGKYPEQTGSIRLRAEDEEVIELRAS